MEPVVAPCVSSSARVLPSLTEVGSWSALQVLPETVQPPASDEVLHEFAEPPPVQDAEPTMDSAPLLQT